MSACAHPVGARQRGAAIVLALSVVALAALAASAMMVSQGVWIRQIELSDGRTQGQFLIQAGIDWARPFLTYHRHTSSVDHPAEPGAIGLPPFPIQNASLPGDLPFFSKLNLVRTARDVRRAGYDVNFSAIRQG